MTNKTIKIGNYVMPDPEFHQLEFLNLVCGQAHLGNPLGIALAIVGGSGTGKTTFIRCLTKVAPKEAIHHATPSFYVKGKKLRFDKTEVQKLETATFSICSELPIGNYNLREGLIKRICDHDVIEAIRLYQDPIEFKAKCLPIFVGNTSPLDYPHSPALARRVFTIRFDVSQIGKPPITTDQMVELGEASFAHQMVSLGRFRQLNPHMFAKEEVK